MLNKNLKILTIAFAAAFLANCTETVSPAVGGCIGSSCEQIPSDNLSSSLGQSSSSGENLSSSAPLSSSEALEESSSSAPKKEFCYETESNKFTCSDENSCSKDPVDNLFMCGKEGEKRQVFTAEQFESTYDIKIRCVLYKGDTSIKCDDGSSYNIELNSDGVITKYSDKLDIYTPEKFEAEHYVIITEKDF